KRARRPASSTSGSSSRWFGPESRLRAEAPPSAAAGCHEWASRCLQVRSRVWRHRRPGPHLQRLPPPEAPVHLLLGLARTAPRQTGGWMFKLLLISIVMGPVLLGMRAAARRGREGLALLLALVLAYDVFYWLLLYYLRLRWVAWGSVPG